MKVKYIDEVKYIYIYSVQFHYWAFCVLVRVVLCCLLNLPTVSLSSLLLGPWDPSCLTWTIVNESLLVPLVLLTYIFPLHTLPSPQKIVNFLNTNQIIHQPEIPEQIPAHRINDLFCSYVTLCHSLNTPYSFTSSSLLSLEYPYWLFKCAVILQVSHVPKITSQTCPTFPILPGSFTISLPGI